MSCLPVGKNCWKPVDVSVSRPVAEAAQKALMAEVRRIQGRSTEEISAADPILNAAVVPMGRGFSLAIAYDRYAVGGNNAIKPEHISNLVRNILNTSGSGGVPFTLKATPPA